MSASYIAFNTINNDVTYESVSQPMFTATSAQMGQEAALLAAKAVEQSAELAR